MLFNVRKNYIGEVEANEKNFDKMELKNEKEKIDWGQKACDY